MSDPTGGAALVGPAEAALEARVVGRLSRRLIPFLIACFCVAYIDRVNVGFAALTMNRDLGFSPTVFGLGAGIFFIGYFALEVPSNIVLARVGARRSIARIMIGWASWPPAPPSSPGRRSSSHCASCSGRPRPASSPACSTI